MYVPVLSTFQYHRHALGLGLGLGLGGGLCPAAVTQMEESVEFVGGCS